MAISSVCVMTWQGHGTDQLFVERERELTDRCDIVIGFWTVLMHRHLLESGQQPFARVVRFPISSSLSLSLSLTFYNPVFLRLMLVAHYILLFLNRVLFYSSYFLVLKTALYLTHYILLFLNRVLFYSLYFLVLKTALYLTHYILLFLNRVLFYSLYFLALKTALYLTHYILLFLRSFQYCIQV